MVRAVRSSHTDRPRSMEPPSYPRVRTRTAWARYDDHSKNSAARTPPRPNSAGEGCHPRLAGDDLQMSKVSAVLATAAARTAYAGASIAVAKDETPAMSAELLAALSRSSSATASLPKRSRIRRQRSPRQRSWRLPKLWLATAGFAEEFKWQQRPDEGSKDMRRRHDVRESPAAACEVEFHNVQTAWQSIR